MRKREKFKPCLQKTFCHFSELAADFEAIEISEMIYQAEIRFDPLISHTYHLYENENNDFLLMMIGPNEWGKKGCPINFISSVKLLADHTWEVVN